MKHGNSADSRRRAGNGDSANSPVDSCRRAGNGDSENSPSDTRRRAGNGDSALAARLSPLRFRRSGLVARLSPLGSRRSALAARLSTLAASPLGSLRIQIWRIDMTHCLISLTLGYYISVSRLCVSIDHISAFSCLVCASEE